MGVFLLQFLEMGCWVFGILLGLVALGVDGYPAEDLVLTLPGQPKVDFRQFAGYVNVDEKKGRSLFYYFAEADEHPEKKPLTIWMNGGWFFFFCYYFISGSFYLLFFLFNFWVVKMRHWSSFFRDFGSWDIKVSLFFFSSFLP